MYAFPFKEDNITPLFRSFLEKTFHDLTILQRIDTNTDTSDPIISLIQYLIKNRERLHQISWEESDHPNPSHWFKWAKYIFSRVFQSLPKEEDPTLYFNSSQVLGISSDLRSTFETLLQQIQSQPAIPAGSSSLPKPSTPIPQNQPVPSFIVEEPQTQTQPQSSAADVISVQTVKDTLYPATAAGIDLNQLAQNVKRDWDLLSWDGRADIAKVIASYIKLNPKSRTSEINFIFDLRYLSPVSIESAYQTAKDIYKAAKNSPQESLKKQEEDKAQQWIVYCDKKIDDTTLPTYYRQEFFRIKQLHKKTFDLPKIFTPTLPTAPATSFTPTLPTAPATPFMPTLAKPSAEPLFSAELAEIKQAIQYACKGTLWFVNFQFTNTPNPTPQDYLWTKTLGELVIMFQDFSQNPDTSQAEAAELLAEIAKLKKSSWYQKFSDPFFLGIKNQLDVIENILRKKAGLASAPAPQPAAAKVPTPIALAAFQNVDSCVTKKSDILPPEKLQQIRASQKQTSKVYEGDMREEVTTYYEQHPEKKPPVLSAKDASVPEKYARQLLTSKRKHSANKKLTSFREEFRAGNLENLDQVQCLTNMDAAMQLLLVQVTPVEAYEDYFYDVPGMVHASTPIKEGLCRKILLDNAIMPDLELGGVDEVYGRILRFNGVKGAPLPQDFRLLTPEEMEDSEKVKEHDDIVERALIHTFVGEQGFGECTTTLSESEALEKIDILVRTNKTSQEIIAALKGVGVKTKDDVTRPLEGFYQVMLHQLRTRTELYEKVSGKEGYILTIDPPGIFITQLGGYMGPAGSLLPLLGALAIKSLKDSNSCPNLQAIAVAAGRFEKELMVPYQIAIGDAYKVHNKSTESVQEICDKYPKAAYGATLNGDGHGKNFLSEWASGPGLQSKFGLGSLEGQMAAIAPCPQLDQRDPEKIVFIA